MLNIFQVDAVSLGWPSGSRLVGIASPGGGVVAFSAFDGGAAEGLWELGAEAGEVAEVELAGAFGGGGGVAVGGVPEPGDDGEFVGEPGVFRPAGWDEVVLGDGVGLVVGVDPVADFLGEGEAFRAGERGPGPRRASFRGFGLVGPVLV